MRMFVRKRAMAPVLICTVAIGVGFASAAQAGNGTAKTAQSCSGGLTNWVTSAQGPSGNRIPIQFAEDLGFFKQNCISHRYDTKSTVTAGTADLISGRAQSTLTAATAIYGLVQSGVKLRIITSNAVAGESLAFVVAKNSPIKSYKDFKPGMSVGLPVLNAATQMSMSLRLSKLRINPRTIKWTVLPPPALGEAVASGRLDAAGLTEPNVALNRDKVRIFDKRPLDAFPTKPAIIAWVITTDKFYKANARLVKGYKAAVGRGSRYAGKNPARGKEAFGRYVNLSSDIQRIVNPPTFSDTSGVNQFLDQINTARRYGFIKPGVSTSTLKKLFVK